MPFEEFDAIGFLGVEQQVEGQTFLEWTKLQKRLEKGRLLVDLLIYILGLRVVTIDVHTFLF